MFKQSHTTLLYGGVIYCPSDPFATAMLISDDQIAWIGNAGAAEVFAADADEVVQLEGALVTPGFVDAHLHITATGLAAIGLDLTGVTSLAQALAAVTTMAHSNRGDVIVGFGWDETHWPEQRPPSREELDRASYGAAVFLDRVDVHSSVVSSAMLAAIPDVREFDGFSETGWLRSQAHDRVRATVYAELPQSLRIAAQRRVRRQAAELGIVALHEMGGPDMGHVADMRCLLNLAASEPGPQIFGYWAQLNGAAQAIDVGAIGSGGDLYVDGAIGSHSAWLTEPYRDYHGTGDSYLSAADIRNHVLQAIDHELQPGFHVIGDGAVAAVIAGLSEAAERVGLAAVRAAGTRLEHLELVRGEDLARLAELGVIASVQPVFDALWGGPEELYANRLGERWKLMNPLAALIQAGVGLAFGSDAPVTPMGPWEAIRAAVLHQTPEHQISTRAAFNAHTRGGWRAARAPGGVIEVGEPAHIAVWQTTELTVQQPDYRVAGWSTDPRSGTPKLPVISTDGPLPLCLQTYVGGQRIYDAGRLDIRQATGVSTPQ